ncbi:hypothetical protein RGU41_10120 [Cryobacterium sp. 10C3]|nr:hypothetical protein [Cryobacterium sp. 10C3]MDY7557070.1 hypothetical protein [Cryobacterium sp. 10C3]
MSPMKTPPTAAETRAALARQAAFAAADAAALDGLLSVRPAEAGPRPEPVWDEATVVNHEVVRERYHRLTLSCGTIAATALAGQFLMITVPPHGGERILLPRPMAIHRRNPERGTIEVIYGVAGRGTTALAAVNPGQRLLVTGPLGRGFEFPSGTRRALMIGRGVGVCAVMGSVEDAAARGIEATLVASGRTRGASSAPPNAPNSVRASSRSPTRRAPPTFPHSGLSCAASSPPVRPTSSSSAAPACSPGSPQNSAPNGACPCRPPSRRTWRAGSATATDARPRSARIPRSRVPSSASTARSSTPPFKRRSGARALC